MTRDALNTPHSTYYSHAPQYTICMYIYNTSISILYPLFRDSQMSLLDLRYLALHTHTHTTHRMPRTYYARKIRPLDTREYRFYPDFFMLFTHQTTHSLLYTLIYFNFYILYTPKYTKTHLHTTHILFLHSHTIGFYSNFIFTIYLLWDTLLHLSYTTLPSYSHFIHCTYTKHLLHLLLHKFYSHIQLH